MGYMLDTDIASYVIRRRPAAVLRTLQDKAAAGIPLVVSSITYAELRLGALRSAAARKYMTLVDEFCERLSDVLAWDKAAADSFSRLQAELLAQGTPIGSNDAMIAGHAMAAGMTLVTNNERHFGKVRGLALENWATGSAV